MATISLILFFDIYREVFDRQEFSQFSQIVPFNLTCGVVETFKRISPICKCTVASRYSSGVEHGEEEEE